MGNMSDDTIYIERPLHIEDFLVMQPHYLCKEKGKTCEYAAVNGWCEATTCINKGMPKVT